MRFNRLPSVNTPKRWWGTHRVNGPWKSAPYFPLLIGVFPTADTTLYTTDTERLTCDNEEV